MKPTTKSVLDVMHVLCWIIFIGLCIKTGAILFSVYVSLFVNTIAAKNLYLGLDLSDLKTFGREHYIRVVLLITILSALKAYLFYLVIKIFKRINFVQPFSVDMAALITKISSVTLYIGILALALSLYSEWLTKKGIMLYTLSPYTGGGGEFLFFAGIIFIISLVFKRGIEIQSENELTV